MNDKVRIRDKEHLEQIFRKFAELDGVEFDDDFVIEGNSELTFGELKETCECIGYENLLLDGDFIRKLENGKWSHCDTFYIDLVGIKSVDCGNRNDVEFFGCIRRPDELDVCSDGTLRIWFD